MAKMSGYTNVAGLNKALKTLPKEASKRLRDAAQSIAIDVAATAAGRASAIGGVAKYVAPTIKAPRDRVPVVKMGGNSRLPGDRSGERQSVGDVIWGAEFGGGARPSTRQFSPHKGRTGYFLWPTVRAENQDIADAYSEALLDALEAI